MLKFSFSETPSEERWILQGRLTAPWFRELRACWKKKHRRDDQRACIVDLNEITFIDKSGEGLLRLLVKEGAQCLKGQGSVLNRLAGFLFAAVVAIFAVQFETECIATGAYIKHVFEQLIIKSKS